MGKRLQHQPSCAGDASRRFFKRAYGTFRYTWGKMERTATGGEPRSSSRIIPRQPQTEGKGEEGMDSKLPGVMQILRLDLGSHRM